MKNNHEMYFTREAQIKHLRFLLDLTIQRIMEFKMTPEQMEIHYPHEDFKNRSFEQLKKEETYFFNDEFKFSPEGALIDAQNLLGWMTYNYPDSITADIEFNTIFK